ncbi:hypothetical protein pb186bvf_018143 [Paramecium bursaria]
MQNYLIKIIYQSAERIFYAKIPNVLQCYFIFILIIPFKLHVLYLKYLKLCFEGNLGKINLNYNTFNLIIYSLKESENQISPFNQLLNSSSCIQLQYQEQYYQWNQVQKKAIALLKYLVIQLSRVYTSDLQCRLIMFSKHLLQSADLKIKVA